MDLPSSCDKAQLGWNKSRCLEKGFVSNEGLNYVKVESALKLSAMFVLWLGVGYLQVGYQRSQNW